MSLPLNRRDYDVFLSHAHVDHEFVDSLYAWLRMAGLSVWYDKVHLAAGTRINEGLFDGIVQCRGIFLIATKEALERGWVRDEVAAAIDQRNTVPGFHVVALRIGDADVSRVLMGTSWIQMPEPKLDAASAVSIISSLYPGVQRAPSTARDVFMSCTWHGDDRTSATTVARVLADEGFRVIGDAEDRRAFGTGNRVERIMSSCGAFVAVVPFREGVEEATASDKPYKYFLQEIDLATERGLPRVVVVDPRVRRVDGGSSEKWLRMPTGDGTCPADVTAALKNLWNEWEPPAKPHFVFCALDLESPIAAADSIVRHLIESITALPVVIGTDVREEPIMASIRRRICDAFVVLADISDNNLNTCIEAGMALAAGVNLEMVAKGEQHSPPFMLRGLQLDTYRDDVQQIAILHKVMRPYRRRVISAEV